MIKRKKTAGERGKRYNVNGMEEEVENQHKRKELTNTATTKKSRGGWGGARTENTGKGAEP